ncbi:MAG: molybdopterin-dependent oxidoreductase [Alphaproteobacteria bacterium]|nr:molybdopterin-dependent oxidoreductase [Alphaproteobacteria bacterium]
MTVLRKMGSDKTGPEISRRGFLAGSSGLTFAVVFAGTGASLMGPAQAYAQPRALSAWVAIGADNRIVIQTPAAEMGQGSMTGVPLALAEELDADWSKVTLDFAPSEAETYGYNVRGSKSMAIVGSRAVQMYYNDVRIAGAQVRRVLLDAAAAKWKVPVSELKTEPSVVIHGPSGRRMTYGQIAAFATAPKVLPKIGKDDLKKPAQFRLIGNTRMQRRDIPAKVNGTAQFAMDVRVPGMVYATTVHAPTVNATPVSWNADKVAGMKDILGTVKLPKGVAIVGRTFEAVRAARDQLEVKWKAGKSRTFDSEPELETAYAKVAMDPKAKTSKVAARGDVKKALAGGAKKFRADFRADFAYHAQMEPLNAVVRFSPDGKSVEVWDGTQSPDRCRETVAKAIGFKVEQVTHHQCYLGGGFGRRSLADYAAEAALVAREAMRPVKLIWTREEDVAYGMFRPQNYQCMEAAMDSSGKVVAWEHCIVGDGRNLVTGGMKIPYYQIANQLQELRGTSHGLRLKHWRAVAHPFNIFAIESFVDEMAAAEGMDPIEFRLKRMSPTPKLAKTFEMVREMSEWSKKRPEGRALGVSLSERSGSLGAGVAEISLDKSTGKIKVHKTWMAVDGGTIVLPDGARANIESGINWGISSMLQERVTIKKGVVEQSNFHDYNVMRMSDVPEEIHIEFVKSTGKPTGLGEIGNPWLGAAIANAVFSMTGKRLRHVPFTPERVLAALKA